MPVKYKRDIQNLACVLTMLKNSEINGTEEIPLVTLRQLSRDGGGASQYNDAILLCLLL